MNNHNLVCVIRRGVIVAGARQCVDLSITHLSHSTKDRDCCVAWTCAFCVAVKHHLRGVKADAQPYLSDQLAGILDEKDADALARSHHPGLYAAHKIRKHAHAALNGRTGRCAPFDAIMMQSIDSAVNSMVLQMGGCERVKSTPLPLVYVAHLRTYLLLSLIALPFVYESVWEWGTPPAVALISYAFLGVEAAASECETPFWGNHINHLNMDGYCTVLINDVEGLVLGCEQEEGETVAAQQ